MKHARRTILAATATAALVTVGVAAALAATFRPRPPVAVAPGDGSQARLGNVSCGQTLTQSTIVANDLGGCPDDGLVVGADGITVDLNGHTIDALVGRSGNGIRIEGFDEVVIKNGTITDFGVGVSIQFGADQTVVRGLRIAGPANGNGIEASALRSDIRDNTVFGSAIGILSAGQANRVASNTAKDNGTGILVGGSESVATGNTVLSNTDKGIHVVGNRAQIIGNVANANGGHGIDVAASGSLAPTTLSSNSASFNTQLGINAGGDVIDEGANTAAGNGSLHQCENVVCVDDRSRPTRP